MKWGFGFALQGVTFACSGKQVRRNALFYSNSSILYLVPGTGMLP